MTTDKPGTHKDALHGVVGTDPKPAVQITEATANANSAVGFFQAFVTDSINAHKLS